MAQVVRTVQRKRLVLEISKTRRLRFKTEAEESYMKYLEEFEKQKRNLMRKKGYKYRTYVLFVLFAKMTSGTKPFLGR